MSTPRIKPILLLTALFAGVVYFSYHGLYGKRGFFIHGELQERHVNLSEELERLRDERQSLEKRIGAMDSGALDPDLLDEEVRRALRYSEPDEIIVFEEMIR